MVEVPMREGSGRSASQMRSASLFPVEMMALSLENESSLTETTFSSSLNAPGGLPTISDYARSNRPDKNRAAMLRRVYITWIEGVLQQSLQHVPLLHLGLKEFPDAVANPWAREVQETQLPSSLLPEGTTIMQVYERAEGKMLLLGEPGAGKTTLLLELARALLIQAESDDRFRIPAVFNLSSWSVKRLSMNEWLIEELRTKYRIPSTVGQAWIERDQMAILLDGLDEVAEDARLACINAIQTYQREHSLVPLVVCCRREDYFALDTRISLQKAVIVQPLSKAQIDGYLTTTDGRLEIVRQALQGDPELKEMVRTPFMLSIVAFAYQESRGSLTLTGSKDHRRRQILHTYIERTLARRAAPLYTPQETSARLAWLAKQMKTHSQTVFYLERLQPDWETDVRSHRHYRIMVNRILIAITVLLYSALLACFRGDFLPTAPGLFFWLGGGKGDSALGWMEPGMGAGMPGGTSLSMLFALVSILVNLFGDRGRTPTFSVSILRRALVVGLCWGILIGGIISIISGIIFSQDAGFRCAEGALPSIACGSSIGLFGGLIVGFQLGLQSLRRYSTRNLSQEEKKQKAVFSFKDRFVNIILFGICGFFGFTAIYSLQSGEINQLALNYGLIASVYFGLTYNQSFELGLIPELGITIQLAETAMWSWRTVRHNFGNIIRKSVLLAAILFGCVVLVITCTSSLFYGFAYGERYGLVYGAIVATLSGVTSVFMGVLISGWSNDMLDERQLVRPNEGTHRTWKNAVFAACLFGPIGGLACGLCSALIFALGGVSGWFVLGVGLTFVLTPACAYQIFTIFGGFALFEHYTLRWSFWRKKMMPWDTIAFLDYAVERILMRKVGGGYMFIHRLLLEHFAEEE